MKYIEGGKLEIFEDKKALKTIKEKEKPVLPLGTIVYCQGSVGTGSFYGIVYPEGVLDLENGSDVYIKTENYIHLGDTISYWTITKVVKSKLIIEDIIESI